MWLKAIARYKSRQFSTLINCSRKFNFQQSSYVNKIIKAVSRRAINYQKDQLKQIEIQKGYQNWLIQSAKAQIYCNIYIRQNNLTLLALSFPLLKNVCACCKTPLKGLRSLGPSCNQFQQQSDHSIQILCRPWKGLSGEWLLFLWRHHSLVGWRCLNSRRTPPGDRDQCLPHPCLYPNCYLKITKSSVRLIHTMSIEW